MRARRYDQRMGPAMALRLYTAAALRHNHDVTAVHHPPGAVAGALASFWSMRDGPQQKTGRDGPWRPSPPGMEDNEVFQ